MDSKDKGLSTGDYRQRLIYFKNTDAERSDMIDELTEKLEQAQVESRQTSLDLESERGQRRILQSRVEDLEALTNRRGFILVLIDADADDFVFHEMFLSRNEAGGRDAADELHSRVKNYVKKLKLDAENIDIAVRAYTDLKSLRSACVKNGKMKESSSMSLFAHGFNQRQALFDFVDVGPGKERADNKVRECLNFFIGIWECKHVILGACHDSGYASFLGKFAGNVSIRDLITLLHSGVIHPRIAELGFVETLQLKSVFASQKTSAAPKVLANAKGSASPVPPSASIAASSVKDHLNPAALTDRLGPVFRDHTGKRVDKLLSVDPNTPYMHFLRQANLCTWYYLRGKCDSCGKNHVPPPLNVREFDCLWFLARRGLCFKVRKGKDCDDPKCIYGHEEAHPMGSVTG